jgi:ribosome-binding protein aMBF1 (putative translation factor)
MSDLKEYIYRRKEADGEFNSGYDGGYEEIKLGTILKELRIQKGMTQEELAEKMHTKKAVISRMENHSEDMRLSTLSRIVEMLDKKLQIIIE